MKRIMIENADAQQTISVVLIWQHAFLATCGGVAHAINAHRNGKTKSMADFFLLALMSSFFGVLFGFIAINFLPNSEYITLAIAGTGGWMGIEGSGILIDIVRKILNINK